MSDTNTITLEEINTLIQAYAKSKGGRYKLLTKEDALNYILMTVKQRFYQNQRGKNLRNQIREMEEELKKRGEQITEPFTPPEPDGGEWK